MTNILDRKSIDYLLHDTNVKACASRHLVMKTFLNAGNKTDCSTSVKISVSLVVMMQDGNDSGIRKRRQ